MLCDECGRTVIMHPDVARYWWARLKRRLCRECLGEHLRWNR